MARFAVCRLKNNTDELKTRSTDLVFLRFDEEMLERKCSERCGGCIKTGNQWLFDHKGERRCLSTSISRKEVTDLVITHKLTMDLEVKEPIKWIEIPQGEVNTRNIRLLLTADYRPWVIPENAVVLIRYRKPDGTEGEYDTLPDGTAAWSAEENVLTISLVPQVLTMAGSVMLYASIRLDDQVLNTFAVDIRVRAAYDSDAGNRIDASEDYFYMTRVMPGPDTAQIGQYICVADVDPQGRVTQVKAVDAAAGRDGEPGADGTGIVAIKIMEV